MPEPQPTNDQRWIDYARASSALLERAAAQQELLKRAAAAAPAAAAAVADAGLVATAKVAAFEASLAADPAYALGVIVKLAARLAELPPERLGAPGGPPPTTKRAGLASPYAGTRDVVVRDSDLLWLTRLGQLA